MHLLLFNGLLVLGLSMPEVMVVGSGPSSMLVMAQDRPTKRCQYNRGYSILQAICSDLGLGQIPSHLQSDIQVLDVSVNRLRDLSNDSLSPYTSLAYLYLGDNFIQKIEESALSPLRYLQVLDLSTNGLQKLPSSLFAMPYLRKLYLTENDLTDEALRREAIAPLEFLQLAKNRLTRIPEIGPQAYLTYLNVSENDISKVSTEDIARFCSLKILDLNKNRVGFDSSSCDCYLFNSWIRTRNIDVRPRIDCNNDTVATCEGANFTNRTMESYKACSEIIRIRMETDRARTTWIVVASCIASFLICIVVVLCFLHRRNKKRRQRSKNEQRLAANNANTELLNSNLQERVYEPNEK